MNLRGVAVEMKSQRAFTLIELLVVIAVIAVWASLVLPALSRAKASSKRAYCQNNLRQIGIALALYADENERFPPAESWRPLPDFMSGATTLWNARLLPFVSGSRDVFFCPAYPGSFCWDDEPSPARYNFPTNIQGGKGFSYAMNGVGLASVGAIGLHRGYPMNGRKPSEIVAPADMIAIGDGPDLRNAGVGGKPGTAYGMYHFVVFQIGRKDAQPFGPGDKHSGGANVLFVDGHVEWAKKWQWIAATDQATRRWNFDNDPHREAWSR